MQTHLRGSEDGFFVFWGVVHGIAVRHSSGSRHAGVGVREAETVQTALLARECRERGAARALLVHRPRRGAHGAALYPPARDAPAPGGETDQPRGDDPGDT